MSKAQLKQDSSRKSERQTLILKALERKPLSAAEIGNVCQVPLPTVYRRLKTLEQQGWITKDKDAYALTSKGRQYLEILS